RVARLGLLAAVVGADGDPLAGLAGALEVQRDPPGAGDRDLPLQRAGGLDAVLDDARVAADAQEDPDPVGAVQAVTGDARGRLLRRAGEDDPVIGPRVRAFREQVFRVHPPRGEAVGSVAPPADLGVRLRRGASADAQRSRFRLA